ncbi:MAG TPA: hypothetical protein VKG86_08360 [Terracidiphilus sp.]|nr:hypothetical protein [Terracidiphilus sp.]
MRDFSFANWPMRYYPVECSSHEDRFEKVRRSVVAALFVFLLGSAAMGNAQTAKPAPNYPTHLPYSFGNFVWWGDDELRALLKKRIPGLGDEIEPTSAVSFSLALFLSSGTAAVAAPQIESIAPLWSANLRTAVGRSPVGVVGGGKGHEYTHKPKTSLWFTDNDTVVATVVTREATDPILSNREAPEESSPLRLRAVYFNALSGKILATPSSRVSWQHMMGKSLRQRETNSPYILRTGTN